MASKKNLIEHYDDGRLDLSLSGIQEIPVRDISAIPKAIKLDLSCNTIVSLPKTFATSLSRLVELDLSQNQISSLPDNFGLLVNLKRLDLDNNKLVSLPLSFGNLKSLRWLDIKRNPLMPKLAQIAGLCQDTQQCQAAARNVVAALRTMQEQVNTEIIRRKEEQTKNIEKIEEANRNQNKESHQSKKKKKKAANAMASDSNLSDANGQTHPVNKVEDGNTLQNGSSTLLLVPSEKSAQKPGFFRKVGNVINATVKFLVMTTLIFVFCGFLLSLIDEDLYMSLRKKVNETIQTNVPKYYLRQWDNGWLMAKRSVASWSSQIISISIHWFNRVQDYFIAISSDEVVQQYLASVKSGWHILWIWLNEAYSTLSVELPRHFNSFKSIIYESSS